MADLPPSNGKTLLITGINGYIASTLGHLLLTKGYHLRGTTRSLSSTTAFLSAPLIASYGDRISILAVPDMTTPGAFDTAVQGVHGIFHTASPISFDLDNYDHVVTPAVAGTVTLLQSALSHAGPQLEAVVVTASVAGIVDPKPDQPSYVYTESDFASASLATSDANKAAGIYTPGHILYNASKTAAERAVWAFRTAHNPPFAISTIHPTVTIGPPIAAPATADKLNATLQLTWNIFNGAALPGPIGSGSFVDVRDVAFLHAWAYEHPAKSDGERYIACRGYGPPQATADILREAYPHRRTIIQAGEPGAGYVGYVDGKVQSVEYPKDKISVSGAKAEREMGIQWVDFKQSVLDTAKVLERYL